MKLIAVSIFALLVASPLFAVTPAVDQPGAAPVLLGLDSVRKELKITRAQANRLDAVRANFRESARKIVTAAGSSPGDASAAASKLEALKTKSNAEAMAVLTGPQRSRFTEIEHQILGGTLLTSPTVQKQLGITPRQAAAIESIRKSGETYVSKVNGQFVDGKISHHERIELLRARRVADAKKMMSVLNPEQQKLKNAMGGRPLATM